VKASKLLKHRWAGTDSSTAPVVEVLWHDATSVWAEDWGSADDVVRAKPSPTVSVGYLVKDAADHLVLVGMANEDHYGHGLVIPRGMIKDVRHL
jgi:hypothetical protein